MSKLDAICEKISSIDSTLKVQAEQLKEHMRRSDLLEKQMQPIQKHVAMVEGVIKFIGILALLGSMVEVWLRLR